MDLNNFDKDQQLKIKDIPYPLKEQHLQEEKEKRKQTEYQSLSPKERRNQKKFDAKLDELVDVFKGKPKHKFRLFGFRSNVLIKKIISCVYLVPCIVILLATIFMTSKIDHPLYVFLDKASSFMMFLIYASPYIFLSETRYRKHLPFFKKRNFFSSLIGLFIVFLISISLFGLCEEKKQDVERKYYDDKTQNTAVTEYKNEATNKTESDIINVKEGNNINDLCYSENLNIVTENGISEETVNPAKTGKITIINFWGTWCTPCVKEMPGFDEIATNYKKQVSVIAVHSNMLNDTISKFIKDNYSDSDIIFATDNSNETYYNALGGVGTYPYTVILDENGIITHIFYRAIEYNDIKNAIEENLK